MASDLYQDEAISTAIEYRTIDRYPGYRFGSDAHQQRNHQSDLGNTLAELYGQVAAGDHATRRKSPDDHADGIGHSRDSPAPERRSVPNYAGKAVRRNSKLYLEHHHPQNMGHVA